MSTLEKGDELLRRIACLKRVIRRLTGQKGDYDPETDASHLADLNTLEAMIVEMGGQVRDVPYSKSKLKRLDVQLTDDTARDMVEGSIHHRDVNDGDEK